MHRWSHDLTSVSPQFVGQVQLHPSSSIVSTLVQDGRGQQHCSRYLAVLLL